MERRLIYYRGACRDPPSKILVILGLLGLPILVGLSAYFWLFKKHNKKWKSRLTSQRVKKGIPPGLVNLGNTCFINCLLQAFSAVKHFCKWIDDLEVDEDKILLSSLKYMLKVLNNKRNADQDVFSASDVIDSLSAHGWTGTSQQQDVHEFFQVLSSTLEDELTPVTSDECGMFLEDVYSKKLIGVINRACRELSVKRLTPVSPFKGALANRMVCLSCGYQSVRFDPFETISLRIPQFSSLTGSSLESCLAEFIKKELVDDVNCPGCTKSRGSFMPVKSRFSKQLTFAKLPKCFCFHIQRSHFLPNGASYKNNQFVRFSDVIDISSCRYSTGLGTTSKRQLISNSLTCGGDEQPHFHDGSSNFPLTKNASDVAFSSSSYRLQSVIVHIGDVDSGHFVTYRRATNAQDDWVYSSDECTKLVSKRSVLSSNAYLLFYERTGQRVSCQT